MTKDDKLPRNVRLYKRVKIDGKWTMRAIGIYSPFRDVIVLKDKAVFERTRPGLVNKARIHRSDGNLNSPST